MTSLGTAHARIEAQDKVGGTAHYTADRVPPGQQVVHCVHVGAEINVGRVIRLNWSTQVFRIAIPAALPMIFTGLRLSLGVGWMVLIAAEMLAQNPGLGKFVWDEFQNGSSDSLGRIMVAVITIGIIGFLLDWLMLTLQGLLSHQKVAGN